MALDFSYLQSETESILMEITGGQNAVGQMFYPFLNRVILNIISEYFLKELFLMNVQIKHGAF